MKISTMGIVAAFAAAAGMAQASVYVNSQFGTFANGNLVGQGGWTQEQTQTTLPLQVNGGVVQVVGGQIVNNQDAANLFSAPVVADESFYLASRLTVTSVPVTNNPSYILAIKQGTFANVRVAFRAGTAPNTFQVAMRLTGQSQNPFQFSSDLPLGQAVNVIIAYDAYAGDQNDEIFGYINPTSSDRGNNSEFASQLNGANSDITSLSGVIISQFGTSSNPTAGVDIASVAVTTTFAEAFATVPTPGSLALLGLGGLVATRRRR